MYGYNPKSESGDFSDANKDRLGDGWTELERYLEWMARAHYTFAKGETQVIDLAQFTKGYDNGSYTVSAPSGVTATVNGSKLTIKLANNFGGVGYIKFTLKDNAGDTFSRDIGVTQQLAISSIVAGDSTEVGDSTTTSIQNHRAKLRNDLRLFPRKQGFHDLKGRHYSKQVPYRVLF